MPINKIRNIAFVGQSGSGKTTLIEKLLFACDATTHLGSIEKGDTVTDFDDQSIQYQHSIEATPVALSWQKHRLNIIDTPGLSELLGRSLSVFPAVETSVLVLDPQMPLTQVTDKLFQFAQQQKKCQMIIINKLDNHGNQLEKLLDEIQDHFGSNCLPINLPSADGNEVVDCFFEPQYQQATLLSSVEAAHETLIDQVVEVDEELMELYLEQGSELTPAQLHDPFEEALRTGHVVPICFASAQTGAGIELLLRTLAELMPMPNEGNPPLLQKNGKMIKVNCDTLEHTVAHVYKISVDPYMGKLAYLRVFQGEINAGSQLYVGESNKAFKVGHLYQLQGKQRTEISRALAGDFCVLAKVDELEFDSIVHDSHDEDDVSLKTLHFPQPMYSLSLKPTKRGDEQKLGEVLNRIVSEDPSLRLEHRARTNETILSGQGEFHLKIALEKMASVYKLEVDTEQPSVEYFETITKPAEGQYRHKKQSGGAGQFGEVHLSVKPLERGAGFQFVNKVVGGAIPTSLIPAVEKGIHQALEEGAISNNPIRDIEVTVHDGKYHSVDSKEIAFVIAGKKAFLDAVKKADPIVLEPIVQLELTIPTNNVGDVTGDLSGNRGLIEGTEPQANNLTLIKGKSPLNELQDYARKLRALTGGEGSFNMSLSHYEPAPPAVQKRVCEETTS
ncbi:elongation factor G [Vibrio vulnificus]|uniref:elongation factor G n=1 Tax=Vibrio vulnificus TaxID=672 RepID=UPI0001F5B165|nr:elongation factor G [Vibrio vulnificus]OJI58153.1 Elongation factor G [Vibrio fluvialis]ADV89359.1 translation elongation factor G-related protein [Vibrio vulnificus MO6-24/O]AIL73390.1 elongation factor G [Vibrio vulnificus]ARN68827.1 Translation elongation factor G-like protein [Vibrio vulnificus]EGR0039767.1 elongation factor G [Vibrio vulnificus]